MKISLNRESERIQNPGKNTVRLQDEPWHPFQYTASTAHSHRNQVFLLRSGREVAEDRREGQQLSPAQREREARRAERGPKGDRECERIRKHTFPAVLSYFVGDDSSIANSSAISFELIAPYYDLLMESVPYRFWLKYLHTLWKHHNHEPQRVIDLACGTGTLSLLMANEGLLVTGVDIAERMLAVARKKSSDAGLYVEYIHQDAAQLDLASRSYDTVVSLFDSLNNINDPAALAECFVRVKEHLVEGGMFIFDVNTAYAFRQGMFDQKSIPSDGPLQYKWKSTYDETTRLCHVTMNFDYRTANGDRIQFEELHVQRAYSTEEILKMLEIAGFRSTSVYDAYSLHPPKRRSDRLFFAGTV